MAGNKPTRTTGPSASLASRRMNKREAAVLDRFAAQKETVVYDFAVDGGATGTINLTKKLPADCAVTAVYAYEETALTSGGSATLQLQAASTDLTDAEAFDTGFTGNDQLALASSATAIGLAAASELKLAIAGAAVTAGKVHFTVHYHKRSTQ